MGGFDFRQLQPAVPTLEEVAAEYQAIHADWDSAGSADQRRHAFDRWDALRRRIETWEAVVQLHFQQDTRNAEYKRQRETCDALRPHLTELAVAMKRKLMQSPARDELAARFGPHLFHLWQADLLSFDPAIQDDLVQESKLEAEYVEMLAAAKLSFQGQTFSHSEIVKFREHLDRDTRHSAEQVRWGWYAAERPKLDHIFAEMETLRDGMARKLGFDNFIGLGYERLKRVDYDQADVERFRASVRQEVVPLGVELRRRQASQVGVDSLKYWDESLFDLSGNPAPQGDHDWMIKRAQIMFDDMGGGMGDFFRLMVDSHLIDLKSREGKAGGGFCTTFPSYGYPFIYANFNGTKGDVEVFTHEMGHALQSYLSREQPVSDYLSPTYESCEIHSMGLEFLTWPWMDQFFGTGADRFRRIHLLQSLLFLPYGVAVDHFQHLVYAEPNATPQRRHEMWREMERMYLPWRDYGDLPHVGDGGFWQVQRHIDSSFYYIDYTLAQTCASAIVEPITTPAARNVRCILGALPSRRRGAVPTAGPLGGSGQPVRIGLSERRRAAGPLDLRRLDASTLILVRHGESALNAANRAGQSILCGQLETPLTAVGRRQAIDQGELLARRTDLRIATAVSSALGRARDTLDLIVPRLPPPINVLPPIADLNERSLGVFEGRTECDVYREFPDYLSDPEKSRFRDDFLQKAPGGENLSEVSDRAWSCVERLLAATSGDLLVVSHAMTIRCILGRALGLAPQRWLDAKITHTQPFILLKGSEQFTVGGLVEV